MAPRGPIDIGTRGVGKLDPDMPYTVDEQYTIGDVPVEHWFLDSNSDYEFPLPKGSFEFIDNALVPCGSAQYDY